jgi:hypothetical protein
VLRLCAKRISFLLFPFYNDKVGVFHAKKIQQDNKCEVQYHDCFLSSFFTAAALRSTGRLAQLVERPLSMREAGGSVSS